MLNRWRHGADEQLLFDENRDAALTLAELYMANDMRPEAERLLDEIEENEPAETAASTCDTASIMRRASLLSRLGQQVHLCNQPSCLLVQTA